MNSSVARENGSKIIPQYAQHPKFDTLRRNDTRDVVDAGVPDYTSVINRSMPKPISISASIFISISTQDPKTVGSKLKFLS